MKKLIVILSLIVFFGSCSKTEMQETSNKIKSADSLLRNAKDGFRTLDSISKIVQDSAKFNRIIVPEIEKQKRNAEKIILENAKSLDSLKGIIKKSKDKIDRSSEIINTVDSAGKVLKETNNPIDVLSTISKTLEKVSKKPKSAEKQNSTEPNTTPTPPQQNPSANNSSQELPPQVNDNTSATPSIKTGYFEIETENIGVVKSEITSEIVRYEGTIISEKYGEQNGEKKQIITAKIPYRNFDHAKQYISQINGNVKSQNIETSGNNFQPNQLCDFEIILTENTIATSEQIMPNQDLEPGVKQNEKNLTEKIGLAGIVILICIILIPFMLLIIYLMNRNMKKKMKDVIEQEMHVKSYSQLEQNIPSQMQKHNTSPESNNKENNEDPYEKYKPKF